MTWRVAFKKAAAGTHAEKRPRRATTARTQTGRPIVRRLDHVPQGLAHLFCGSAVRYSLERGTVPLILRRRLDHGAVPPLDAYDTPLAGLPAPPRPSIPPPAGR